MPVHSPILDSFDRPDSPGEWIRTDWKIGEARAVGFFPPAGPNSTTHDGASFDFTWHHNIPWKTLRDSFKVAFVFCQWEATEDLLRLYGFSRHNNPALFQRLKLMRAAINVCEDGEGMNVRSATYEKWVDRFKSGSGSWLSSLAPEKQLTNDDVDMIVQNVAWREWNIVEGPKESIRVEDPGSDGFDDFRDADPDRFDRYMAAFQLHNCLEYLAKDYEAKKGNAADPDYMKTNWSVRLRAAARNAQFLVNERLVKFSTSHWRVMPLAATKDLSGKKYWFVRTRNEFDPKTVI
ncbi:MAG: hypothetical protein J5I93_13710 [Pirellulaceae bacterium]|nr:hypothetical protein [Pirellulaceae bacterium]